MSMDYVQPPYKYSYFSPPIKLKKFLDDAVEAEKELFNFFNGADRQKEEDVRDKFISFTQEYNQDAVEAQKTVNEVDSNLEHIIEQYPVIEFEPAFPPLDSTLHSHIVLNDMRKKNQVNTKVKNTYLKRGRYSKYRDFFLERTLEPNVNVSEKDVVITVNLLSPMNTLSNHPPEMSMRKQCEVKYHIRGDMPLSKLREKIFCQADFWCNKQDFEEANDSNNYFLNKYPSGFFFIYDTFYVDRTNPNSVDISQQTREFMTRKKKGFKDHYVKDIKDIKIIDLTIRLGQPYVFIHQGHCEHLVIFTDLRLMNVNDMQDVNEYPLIIYDNIRNTNCCVCKDSIASFVVTESDRMPVNPGFMCYDCFKQFHYERKMRIGNFKAYHFIDRGCLE